MALRQAAWGDQNDWEVWRQLGLETYNWPDSQTLFLSLNSSILSYLTYCCQTLQ
jgi:hypothetical protein